MEEQKQQEIIYKLGKIEQQMQQTQQQLQMIEQGILDMGSLDESLDELKDSKGREIMAPLGRGIFVKAKLISEKLTVDVGENNFVTKDISETKKLIEEQKNKLEEMKQNINLDLEEKNKEFMGLITKAQNEKE